MYLPKKSSDDTSDPTFALAGLTTGTAQRHGYGRSYDQPARRNVCSSYCNVHCAGEFPALFESTEKLALEVGVHFKPKCVCLNMSSKAWCLEKV